MKNNYRLLLIIGIILIIVVGYNGVKYYNSEDVVFNRYLNKITSVSRRDIQASDVHIAKNGYITKSYFDENKSYLVLDLLSEIGSLNQLADVNNVNNYSTSIKNVFETSKAIYEIRIDVDESNYGFRINELTIDLDSGDKIAVDRYYDSNERSVETLSELLSF